MACYAAAPALLMPTTAADTLIPHAPGGEEEMGWEWESRAVAAAAASRREMSGETRAVGWVH